MAHDTVSSRGRRRTGAGRAVLGALLALPLLIGGALAQDAASPPTEAPAAIAPATPPTMPEPAAQAPVPSTSAAETPGTVFPSGMPRSIPPLASPPSTTGEPASETPGATGTGPAETEIVPAGAPEGAAAAGTASLPHDLSPWGMFMAADYVVKSVMIGLAFASVVTWTIWLAKVLELTGAKTRASSGVRRLGRAEGLPSVDAVDAEGWKRGPVAAMVRTAAEERARSAGLPSDGVKERVAVALQRIEARAGRRMARGTGLLATIGSTAPFVGLFGTVWGIMNSFIGISQANTTNLAVVAPGIAEALLATAIGLVAAIPAVIIYNVFARAISGYRAVLSDASAAVLQHLSRDLDRAKLAGVAPRAGYPRSAAAE